MKYCNKRYPLVCLLVVLSLAGCLFAAPCRALEPAEILVLANRNAARSVGLAKYYMKKRKIPPENLIQLWVTDKETCSRSDYEKKLVDGYLSLAECYLISTPYLSWKMVLVGDPLYRPFK